MFDRQADGRDRAAAAKEAAARVAELEQALSVALAHVAELEQAVESRDVIGRATGILMQRYGVGPEEAFAELVRRSQALNVKLGQIAERVSSHHEP